MNYVIGDTNGNIKIKHFSKLWPGEYGCKVNDECVSRSRRAYCQANSDKPGIGQCRCRDSHLLFGRCCTFKISTYNYEFVTANCPFLVKQCPEGTIVKDDECELEDEDGFWKSLYVIITHQMINV